MLKKILKYTLRTLLVLFIVLVLVVALIYVPGVQNFVRKRAVGYASEALGMDVSVGRLRLAFPLRLTVDDALLADKGDTILYGRRLSLDVAVWPLLRREVVVRTFELDTVAARYSDSTAGMDMRLALGVLSLDARADLAAKTVGIQRIELSRGGVFMDMTEAVPVEKADTAAAQPWKIAIGTLAVDDLTFGMRTAPAVTELSVRLAAGRVDSCRVALAEQQVDVQGIVLDRGIYTYRTAPAGGVSDKASVGAEPDSAAASVPWTVRVGSVALTDNSAEYGALNHRPAAGFDPEFIALTSLELSVDSLYNRGGDVALRIGRLSFDERSGLSVRDASGAFGMDADGITLTDFQLATPFSSFRADLSAGAGMLRMEPDSPLSAALSASVDTKDVKYLYPGLITPVLDNRIVRMDLTASGTLDDIGRVGLNLSSPGHIDLTIDGAAKNVLAPDEMVASARFEGDFQDMAFLLAMLPDTALRHRVSIPERIGLAGTAGVDRGACSLDAALTVAEGRLALKGGFDPRRQLYEAQLRIDTLALNRFLPADSLGRLDMTLHAQGAGFDPLGALTRSDIRVQIARAEYRGRDFGGIELEAHLEDQHLAGRLSDRDEALRLLLSIAGTLTGARQQVRISGGVSDFDLQALGLTTERLGGAFTLEAEASATAAGAYAARVELDSIEIRSRYRTDRLRPIGVTFSADTAATRAGLTSGDLSLAFFSPEAPDSLIAAMTRSADVLTRQVRAQRVDMDALKPALPDFRLRVSAGRENIFNNFLKTRKAAFRELEIEGQKCDSLPLALDMRVDGLTSKGIRLDTVTAGIRQQDSLLQYYLRVANAPGNLDHVALAGVYGHIVGNTGQVNLYQQNRAGREGFGFGLDAMWTDSLIRASVIPRNPVFGFEPWTVNPGNYLVYRFDRSLSADLDLTHGDQRFAIHTVSEAGLPDGIRLDIAGLNIGSALELLPSAPPVDGVLGADVTLKRTADSMTVRGDLSVAGLSYDKQRFGDVDFGLFYGQGRGHRADARLTLDGAEVLSVQGDYREGRESPLDLTVAVPDFPLQPVNVFLPADMLRLAGHLQGRVHLGGAFDRLKLDGGLRFAQTEIRVPMIGTAFRLASDTIRIADSRVLFDDYAVTAPNKSPLVIGGEVDLSDLKRVAADLSLRASDFQFVNVARREGTAVYGKAYLDLDASARGPVDELVVRGNVALLGGTDINYIMQDSPMEVKERPQNVVTFVSFADLDSQGFEAPSPAVQIGGMDVLMNIDINSDVKAAVDLSADGNNRIDLQGGGNLTYTLNPLGDMSLSGKYVLSGGTVRYNPPVISQKIFKITPDSYVDWVGNVADPAFNITAVETVRANVSTDDRESRSVNFDISINIRNTLDDLEVSFGLAAPEDLTMQNQLNSLTAEQRANQAMNLLIYNTYTGPGTTAKVSTENPLNSFIQKELNQWAQNNLRGVDLSFGIDSYGEDDPNGQRTDYSYRLSKNLFGNRVRAVIGGKITTDTDPSQNLRDNLIDDISLEYMLTKRDNMYLRVFRHTGYESILEGEITETGVGFVIRKKLLRLGDLFKPTRPKAKKNEKK